MTDVAKVQKGPGQRKLCLRLAWLMSHGYRACGKEIIPGVSPPAAIGFHWRGAGSRLAPRMQRFAAFLPSKSGPARPRNRPLRQFRKPLRKPEQCFRSGKSDRRCDRSRLKRWASRGFGCACLVHSVTGPAGFSVSPSCSGLRIGLQCAGSVWNVFSNPALTHRRGCCKRGCHSAQQDAPRAPCLIRPSVQNNSAYRGAANGFVASLIATAATRHPPVISCIIGCLS